MQNRLVNQSAWFNFECTCVMAPIRFWFLTNTRSTWPLFVQTHILHRTKNKYKSHARSHAIYQTDISCLVLARKGHRHTWLSLFCLVFNWVWPTSNQSERPFVQLVCVFLFSAFASAVPRLKFSCIKPQAKKDTHLAHLSINSFLVQIDRLLWSLIPTNCNPSSSIVQAMPIR